MRKYFILLALLVGCEEPINNGVVVKKDLIQAHDETHYITIHFGDIPVYIPITDHIPTMYYIDISKDGEKRCIMLDKFEWDSYNLGDKFPHIENPHGYTNRRSSR